MLADHFPFTSDDPTRIAAHVLPTMTNLENDLFEYLKSKLVGEPAEGINNIRSLISAIPAGPKQGNARSAASRQEVRLPHHHQRHRAVMMGDPPRRRHGQAQRGAQQR